jgi:hypothetical protein
MVVEKLSAGDSLNSGNDALRRYRVREGRNVTGEAEGRSGAALKSGADAFSYVGAEALLGSSGGSGAPELEL